MADKVIDEMNDWAHRPSDEDLRGGVALNDFVQGGAPFDAIVVEVRDGQVANRPFYAEIGVSLAEERDILGLGAGNGR